LKPLAFAIAAALVLGISDCGEPGELSELVSVSAPAFQEPTVIEEEGDMLKLDGILEGEIAEQASPDATLRTIGLVLMKGSTRTKLANMNLTITANSSGNPRVDLVQWNGTALTVKAGTAGADPACPSPDAGNIPIAVVYVPTGFSNVRSLGTGTTSQAVMIAIYGALKGLWAIRRQAGSAQAIADVTLVELTNTSLPVYIPKGGSSRYRLNFNGVATLQDANCQLSLRFQLDGANETPDSFAQTGDIGSANAVVAVSTSRCWVSGVGNAQMNIDAGPHKFKVLAATNGPTLDVSLAKQHHSIEQLY
jgi:hypothetical protein